MQTDVIYCIIIKSFAKECCVHNVHTMQIKIFADGQNMLALKLVEFPSFAVFFTIYSAPDCLLIVNMIILQS